MASAFGKSAPVSIIDAVKKNIDSLTHRYWVLNDLEKRMGKILASTSRDIILLDFLDERFNLASLEDNSIITITNEFRRANIDESNFDVIKSKSERHYDLWKTGLDAFASLVDQKQVFINKVYWATGSDDDSQFNEKYISENNQFLDNLYNYATKNYDFNVIDYDKNIFICDASHKWGKSPFHYTHLYYDEAMTAINAIAKDRSIP